MTASPRKAIIFTARDKLDTMRELVIGGGL